MRRGHLDERLIVGGMLAVILGTVLVACYKYLRDAGWDEESATIRALTITGGVVAVLVVIGVGGTWWEAWWSSRKRPGGKV